MQRQIMLTAAVIFGAFGITALVFNQTGVSRQTLSLVGGAAAYLFLAAVVVIMLRAWRVKGRDPVDEAIAFVRRHPRVAATVGHPANVGHPEGEIPGGSGDAQANLDVVVSGPDGLARVDLVMVRMGRRWEVLSATLTSEGECVSLREGPVESA
ncbi:MAG: cytochrome c oxidase assembly factor Coa1 family protein [Miltoncostaeaceae bacterium]